MSEKTIQQAFLDFHRQNPHVYDALVRLARQARGRGHERIGIELLFAVLRWERMMAVKDPSQGAYKLNDHYTSRYARLIMEREADLEGLFAVRELRSAGPSRLYAVPPPVERVLLVERNDGPPVAVVVTDGRVSHAGPPLEHMIGFDGRQFRDDLAARQWTWRDDEPSAQLALG